jgi:phosphoglycerate dehydrogenase-like enzyme
VDDVWRLAAFVPMPAEAVRGFAPDLPVEVVVPEERTPEAARAAVADADLLLGDFTALLRVDADLVAAAPRLAFVQQPTVGVEHIDLAACAAAGIPVANTAGANAVGVAEWCVMAALAVSRNLLWADAEVRAGRWPQLDLVSRGCLELSGRRVGIVGYGAVGAAAAERFAAFGCDVSYWSRTARPAAVATYRALPDLLATSDMLVVVIALGDETRGLLDAAALRSLPRGAVVVNAARGGIVDEASPCSTTGTSPEWRSTSTTPSRCPRAHRCAGTTASCCRRTSRGRPRRPGCGSRWRCSATSPAPFAASRCRMS